MSFCSCKSSSYNALLKYTDYEMLQHTTNYCLWTSSSTCGWNSGNANSPTCIIGIIRDI